MGVRGTYIGLSALVPENLEGSNLSPNMIRLEPNNHKVMPIFLWHYLHTNKCKREIASITDKWKVGFGTIKSKDLKEISIPTPHLDRQHKVSDLLEKLNFLNETIEKNYDEPRNLLNSYLNLFF